MSMLTLLLSLSSAVAETSLVDQGQVHLTLRNRAAAQSAAAAALAADDTRLEAHRLYIAAWITDEQLTQQYRAWLDADPEATHRRIAMALALLGAHAEAGEWCDEVETLLEGLTPDTAHDQQFWTLYSQLEMQQTCEREEESALQELLALGADHPAAAAYGVKVRIRRGQIDAALISDLRTQLETYPEGLREASALWGHAVPDAGRSIRRARSIVLQEARSHLSTDDPLVLSAAMWALRSARDDDFRTARASLRALMGEPPAEDNSDPDSKVTFGDIIDANRVPSAELALEALAALEDDVPEDGPLRALLEEFRAERLESLGQLEASVAAAKRAWEADPEDAHVANEFAWKTATSGLQLEEGLKAADAALAQLSTYSGVELQFWQAQSDWQDGLSWQYAAYLDTRGWILHQLDRNQEAAASLWNALLIDPMSETHVHLCVVLHTLGEDTAAFEQLVQAFITNEQSLPSALHELQEPLYAASGIWHPEGLEGYLQHRADTRPAEEGDDSETFALLGEPLPFTGYQDIQGREQPLEATGRILLLDFWATWCGPCIQGMPHLQKIAVDYQEHGVEVMGLSVDSDLDVVQKFFNVDFEPLYTVGWVGPEGFDIGQFSGIPSLFVVDTDGTIAEYIVGYSGAEDTRIEDAIEAILADDEP